MRRVHCFFGFHEWFLLKSGDVVPYFPRSWHFISHQIMARVTVQQCKYCGKRIAHANQGGNSERVNIGYADSVTGTRSKLPTYLHIVQG